jgi:hypothetical protein
MITTFEQWKENGYLYSMINSWISDRLIKRIFDEAKSIGIDIEKAKHKWIPINKKIESCNKLIGNRVLIKSELGCTHIGKLKKVYVAENELNKNNICYNAILSWYDDNGQCIDESFDKIIAYQLLPTD